MELPELGSFDSAQPEAYYLGHGASELLATADAVLVVEGQRLNVHSQVLSVQSRVLRSLFTARAEGVGGGGSDAEQQPAAKRARHGASSSRGADATAAAVGAAGQEPVVLEQALEGFRLRDVSLFLRLTYHLEEAEPGKLYSGLYWELSSLAGAARLAHQLDAPRVLAALVAAMQRSVESLESTPTLTAWLNAAEHCQQGELQASCIRRLAHRLLCGTSSDRGSGGARRKRDALQISMDELKNLRGISQDSLQVVFGALLASARDAAAASAYAGRGLHVVRTASSYLPSADSIQQALGAAGGAAGGSETTGDAELVDASLRSRRRCLELAQETETEEEESEDDDSFSEEGSSGSE